MQLNLVNPQSLKDIVFFFKKMTLMHMELIVLGIKGLTRKNLGAKVLIVLYDDRCTYLEKPVIGSTEVNMTNNRRIFYISPNFLINLKEFGTHIEIEIQTKGYEEMNNGSNLLMCIGLLGKMTVNSKLSLILR